MQLNKNHLQSCRWPAGLEGLTHLLALSSVWNLINKSNLQSCRWPGLDGLTHLLALSSICNLIKMICKQPGQGKVTTEAIYCIVHDYITYYQTTSLPTRLHVHVGCLGSTIYSMLLSGAVPCSVYNNNQFTLICIVCIATMGHIHMWGYNSILVTTCLFSTKPLHEKILYIDVVIM